MYRSASHYNLRVRITAAAASAIIGSCRSPTWKWWSCDGWSWGNLTFWRTSGPWSDQYKTHSQQASIFLWTISMTASLV